MTSLGLLPWEADSWKPIFDPNYDPFEAASTITFVRPPPLGPDSREPVLSAKKRRVTHSDPKRRFMKSVVHKPEGTWSEQREAQMQTSLKRWLVGMEAVSQHCGSVRKTQFTSHDFDLTHRLFGDKGSSYTAQEGEQSSYADEQTAF